MLKCLFFLVGALISSAAEDALLKGDLQNCPSCSTVNGCLAECDTVIKMASLSTGSTCQSACQNEFGSCYIYKDGVCFCAADCDNIKSVLRSSCETSNVSMFCFADSAACFKGPFTGYLAGWAGAGSTSFNTLQQAKDACALDSQCSGVTKSSSGTFTNRKDSTLKTSPHNEVSYRKCNGM